MDKKLMVCVLFIACMEFSLEWNTEHAVVKLHKHIAPLELFMPFLGSKEDVKK